MKHKTREELKQVAAVHSTQVCPTLTRSERLERWAEVLERAPDECLSTLHGTEYVDSRTRDEMRTFRSPFSLAFADPVLRAAGLPGDSYGEARRFFELTHGQLHDIVCYCHHGATIRAGTAAQRVRAAASKPPQAGLFARLRDAVFG